MLELTAASLEKVTISPLGFEDSLWCKKFESENFKIGKFFHISFLLPTNYCQEKVMEGFSAKSILEIKIELCENLRNIVTVKYWKVHHHNLRKR